MESILTDDESMELIQALLETRGDAGATEEDAGLLLAWGTEARVSYHLLNLVLAGRIQVDVRDGDIIFSKKL